MAGQEPVDLFIIGGGINGAGIARDAAGRGLSVVLCEQADLGSGTSSASTKLIHGGLRYLETYEFRLVRESLIEREVLLRAAPHIIWPLRFVLPHDRTLRPAWMIRAGLFLYDHLGGRKRLPGSRSVDLRRDPAGAVLKSDYRKAFSYADCWVEDSRLVVVNAMDAAERGAIILPRTRCLAARRLDGVWEVEVAGTGAGQRSRYLARAVVNAAGPWVGDVLATVAGASRSGNLRLVKGSHIVVPRLADHDSAYIFQNADGRIVFVIPYEQAFSLIGTTDIAYHGDPAEVSITEGEIDYLCAAVNRYLKRAVTPEEVVWTYSGVRPLYDDANENVSAITRDYTFDLDAGAEGTRAAPLLSIFGGKITTYRKLAEHALEKLLPHLDKNAKAWTAKVPLPGGDIRNGNVDAYVADLTAGRTWLPRDLARRYVRAYGTRIERLLNGARSLADLGEDYGDGVYQAELDYLRRYEWAATADDVLWRRSKLGLHVSEATKAHIARAMGDAGARRSGAA